MFDTGNMQVWYNEIAFWLYYNVAVRAKQLCRKETLLWYF